MAPGPAAAALPFRPRGGHPSGGEGGGGSAGALCLHGQYLPVADGRGGVSPDGGAARAGGGGGQLPAACHTRIERLAGRLDRLLEEPARPALLHGDVWSGNVLFTGTAVAAFLDPAISFGHPEIELAFTRLFGPFGEAFYRAYDEIAGIAPGFFEARADLYNLYPLLVHVHLFGQGYLARIDATLRRHGL